MRAVTKPVAARSVDMACQPWVVRDPDGNVRSLPTTDNPWDKRHPLSPAEEADLGPVPDFYQYMLGLPVWQKASGP